jgi:hypothetical protein
MRRALFLFTGHRLVVKETGRFRVFKNKFACKSPQVVVSLASNWKLVDCNWNKQISNKFYLSDSYCDKLNNILLILDAQWNWSQRFNSIGGAPIKSYNLGNLTGYAKVLGYKDSRTAIRSDQNILVFR